LRKKPVNTTSVFRRTLFLLVMFGIVTFFAVTAKLFQVQMVDYEQYQQKAVSQQTRNEIITPSRGVIYDRNMKELAISATVETVSISPVDIVDHEKEKDQTNHETAKLIADGLSQILDLEYEEVYEKTQKSGSYHQYIKRKIEKEDADKVREFITENKLSSMIHLTTDTKRYYPYGSFASHLIGFCGMDNNGLYGLELQYDEYLSGTPGRIVAAKNARGVDMPFQYEQYYDAEDGHSLVLTIDEVVQHYLEKHLESALENAQAANGVCGIVMDVTNGEVLAMSTQPDYDLNDPFNIGDENLLLLEALTEEDRAEEIKTMREKMWINKVINDTYEPGSVFKIITAAMAVEENVINSNDSFFCSGSVQILDRNVGCWKDEGHGAETFVDGVKNSCNPVFIELGNRLGASTFFKYFKAFGFTQKTGVNLPGESGGSSALYHSESYLQSVPVSLAVSTFGQTFKITPLQMITAVCAAVNGGTLYQPKIVKQIVDENGTVVENFDSNEVRQVISPETSEIINAALEEVVTSGTGTNAYVAGYRVGGKTGTTVKTETKDEFGETKLRISSFLGFAPADDPKIAVLICVDEPTTGVTSGNMLAAPYVAAVIEDVLPYLGIEPQYTEEEEKSLETTIPDFTGLTRAKAEELAKEYKLAYEFKGDGDVVTDQMPVAGSIVPRDAGTYIYMGGERPTHTMKVPNIEGMTLAGIQKLLKGSYLYIRPQGVNKNAPLTLSVSQDPAWGTEVEAGTVITINFLDNGNTGAE